MAGKIDQVLLTAYALGELDEVHRQQVEAHLDAEARQAVQEVRATAQLVKAALGAEAGEGSPGLDDMRRAAIMGQGPRVVPRVAPQVSPRGVGHNQELREAAQSVRDEYGPTPVYHVIAPAVPRARQMMPWLVAAAALLLVASLGILWMAAQEKTPVSPVAQRDEPAAGLAHNLAALPLDEQGQGLPQREVFTRLPADAGDLRSWSDPDVWKLKLKFDPAEARRIAQGEVSDLGAGPLLVGPPAPRWEPLARSNQRALGALAQTAPRVPSAPLGPYSAMGEPPASTPPWLQTPALTSDVGVGNGVQPGAVTPVTPSKSSTMHNVAPAPLTQGVTSRPPPAPTPAEIAAAQTFEEVRANMTVASRTLAVPESEILSDDRPAAPPTVAQSYAAMFDNRFLDTAGHPISVFSMYVENGTYAHLRRMLAQSQLPGKDAVRIEEWVNYFSYHHPPAVADETFSVDAEVAACPWNTRHRLVRLAVTAQAQANDARPADNLMLLVNVSATMLPQRLGMLKGALQDLAAQLGENDHLGIVVFGSASGLVLPPTTLAASDRAAVRSALDHLEDGGDTRDGQGIELAYRLATQNLIDGGVNRVILITDGGANVGVKNTDELMHLIQDRASAGLSLSVLGMGVEAGSDTADKLTEMAQMGRSTFTAVDTPADARRALADELRPDTAVATNVKVRVAFNTARVASYRLLGFEKGPADPRQSDEDIIGGPVKAGQSVTALYEVMPAAGNVPRDAAKEMLAVRVRYEEPDTHAIHPAVFPVVDAGKSLAQASADFKFAASVGEFAMLLRQSPYKGSATFDSALKLARDGKGDDESGRRAEFIEMVQKAQTLGH